MDEPVSPAGRFFLRPEMQQVINCGIGLQNPPDVPAIKAELRRTLLRYHPRLSCLLVTDEHGREHWRPAQELDLDKHIILVPEEDDDDGRTKKTTAGAAAPEAGGCGRRDVAADDDERYVNDYVASLTVSTPLGTDKPLWEVHVLPPRRRCCVLRMHHALGDGVALMSLFLACCERADDPSVPVTIPGAGGGGRTGSSRDRQTHAVRGRLNARRRPFRWWWWWWAWRAVLVAWYTLLYVADFLMHSLWKKDDDSPITGGAGVELWPRRLVTTSFDLEDLKAVKRPINADQRHRLAMGLEAEREAEREAAVQKRSRQMARVQEESLANAAAVAEIKEKELEDKMRNKYEQWAMAAAVAVEGRA